MFAVVFLSSSPASTEAEAERRGGKYDFYMQSISPENVLVLNSINNINFAS